MSLWITVYRKLEINQILGITSRIFRGASFRNINPWNCWILFGTVCNPSYRSRGIEATGVLLRIACILFAASFNLLQGEPSGVNGEKDGDGGFDDDEKELDICRRIGVVRELSPVLCSKRQGVWGLGVDLCKEHLSVSGVEVNKRLIFLIGRVPMGLILEVLLELLLALLAPLRGDVLMCPLPLGPEIWINSSLWDITAAAWTSPITSSCPSRVVRKVS